MHNFKMMIVDDDDSIRDIIPRFLSDREIECESYETAEEVIARLYPCAINDWSQMPDLIIIDLKLDKGPMQGIDLIKELIERNTPCELIAISGAIPPLEYQDDIICFGAALLLPKPFDLEQFFPRAVRLAEIARKRRMSLPDSPFELKDESRKDRPVFLSYAEEDRHLANGIRRHLESFNIDVWYAPAVLSIGAEWYEEIQKGISNARIFIPLISDHFIASENCLEELYKFRHRMDHQPNEGLLLLPVVDRLSQEARNSDLFRSIEKKYHYNYLRPRVADCLTALIWKIQAHLEA